MTRERFQCCTALLALAVAIMLSMFAARVSWAQSVELTLPDGSRQVTLSVPKLVCSSCSATIREKLTAVPGVKAVRFDVARRQATVTWDPARATLQSVRETMKQAGFEAAPVAPGGKTGGAGGSCCGH